MMSLSVAPPGRFSSSSTWAVLLPWRAAGFSGWAAFLAPLGAFLAGLAFFPDFVLAGATWGFGGATVAFVGATCSPSPATALQIRATAVRRLLNFLAGTEPGRPFQISTSRSAVQFVA